MRPDVAQQGKQGVARRVGDAEGGAGRGQLGRITRVDGGTEGGQVEPQQAQAHGQVGPAIPAARGGSLSGWILWGSSHSPYLTSHGRGWQAVPPCIPPRYKCMTLTTTQGWKRALLSISHGAGHHIPRYRPPHPSLPATISLATGHHIPRYRPPYPLGSGEYAPPARAPPLQRVCSIFQRILAPYPGPRPTHPG